MLTKLITAFSLLREDLTALKDDVERIGKVRQVVKNGVDGVSPNPEEIISAVLERMPAAKNGESPDPQAIAEAAAKLIPEPKPGRDAVPPTVRDVADVVLAKIEKPKDGVSPDPQAIAVEAAKLLPVPKNGISPTAEEVAKKMPNPQRGKTGAPGKNGISITDVQLNNNELFVFLDGKKNLAGKIKLPAISAPFRPGGGGGSGPAIIDVTGDNAVYVASASDFLNQTDTHIILEESVIYIVVKSFTTDKPFICQDNSFITARNLDSYLLTYDGVEDMFSATDANFAIREIKLNCPNAMAFRSVETVGLSKNFLCNNVQVLKSKKAAVLDGLGVVELFNSAFLDSDDGVTFAGSNILILSLEKLALVSQSSSFKGIDLGSLQILNTLEISNVLSVAPAGAFGFSGLPNSGNIPLGREGMISNCEFAGGMTPLENLDPSDVRYEYVNNVPLPNSINQADAYLTGGAETLTIVTQGVFEEIGVPAAVGVTWATEHESRFSVSTAGVITYIGENPLSVKLSGTITLEKVGGGSDQLEARFAKNWTPGQSGIDRSRAVTQNSTPTSIPVSAIINIVGGDNLRVIFANNSSISNIVVQVASITVQE